MATPEDAWAPLGLAWTKASERGWVLATENPEGIVATLRASNSSEGGGSGAICLTIVCPEANRSPAGSIAEAFLGADLAVLSRDQRFTGRRDDVASIRRSSLAQTRAYAQMFRELRNQQRL